MRCRASRSADHPVQRPSGQHLLPPPREIARTVPQRRVGPRPFRLQRADMVDIPHAHGEFGDVQHARDSGFWFWPPDHAIVGRQTERRAAPRAVTNHPRQRPPAGHPPTRRPRAPPRHDHIHEQWRPTISSRDEPSRRMNVRQTVRPRPPGAAPARAIAWPARFVLCTLCQTVRRTRRPGSSPPSFHAVPDAMPPMDATIRRLAPIAPERPGFHRRLTLGHFACTAASNRF